MISIKTQTTHMTGYAAVILQQAAVIEGEKVRPGVVAGTVIIYAYLGTIVALIGSYNVVIGRLAGVGI